MADAPRDSGAGAAPGPETPPGMPRWLKVSAIVFGVVVLAAVALMLLVDGGHGPGRHGEGAQPEVEAPEVPGERASRDHAPPAGGRV